MNAWIHHPSPSRSVSRFVLDPHGPGRRYSTSLLWRWELDSIHFLGREFIPDFSPHSSSAGLFSQTLLFYLLSSSRDTSFWLRVLSWSQASQSFLLLREPSAWPLVPDSHWVSIASLLTTHFSHPFTVPLTFTRISRHLSELLSNHPCSSDSCQNTQVSTAEWRKFVCGTVLKIFLDSISCSILTLCKYNKVCQHLYNFSAWRDGIWIEGWKPLIFVPTWDQTKAFRK